MCYSSKTRVERISDDQFTMSITNDVVVEKISVKISIQQIVSFLSMISNTSNILTEKYLNRILKDINPFEEKRSPNNSLSMKPVFEKTNSNTENAKKLTETFKVFSSRFYQENQPTDPNLMFDVGDEHKPISMNKFGVTTQNKQNCKYFVLLLL
jgi:hypothetical protein